MDKFQHQVGRLLIKGWKRKSKKEKLSSIVKTLKEHTYRRVTHEELNDLNDTIRVILGVYYWEDL